MIGFSMQDLDLYRPILFSSVCISSFARLCGLVVRVPGYRSRGPGLIPGDTKFSEK
jgi:hypothetical protein